MKVQRAIVVTSASAWAWASHLKVLRQSFFVMGKALSGELSCKGTGLVNQYSRLLLSPLRMELVSLIIVVALILLGRFVYF